MSYIALVTDQFDAMCAFYGPGLGGAKTETWDRPGARGVHFELAGQRVEILDNAAEKQPRTLGKPDERAYLVFEIDDEAAFRAAAQQTLPTADPTSWGPRAIRLKDPDGTPVTLLF